MSLNSSDFKRIMSRYDIKQNENKKINKLRKSEIYEKIPKIKEIDMDIYNLSLISASKIMDNPENTSKIISEMKNNSTALINKKKALLVSHGYEEDYLMPLFDCTLCNDTGYIGSQKCTCLNQAIIDFAYEQSNLKNILNEENFDTFSFDFYSKDLVSEYSISPYENMKIVFGRCLEFVENFDSNFSNLILYGQAGLGKTFLCNCIAKELLDSSHTVIYLSSFQLFKLFENYRFKNDENIVSADDVDSIYSCDLLIIDDLGTEIVNAFTSAELFNTLNTRLLQKKSTVISTNLRPQDWSKQYSDRIVSRVFGNYIPLKFFGTDIRMQKYN